MRKVEKTLGYILMSLLLTLILGLPNISYAVENTQSYKTKIENLGVTIPFEIAALPNAEVILQSLYEDAQNQTPAVYNYKAMSDLYNEIREKIPFKTINYPFFPLAAYSLINSTKYGSWSDSFSIYNCYGYSINKQQWLRPGQLSGYSFSLSMPISEMAQLVIHDLNATLNGDWSIYKTTSKPASIPSGGMVISIRKGTRDFHFMKAVSSTSTWRHKPGGTNPLTWNYTSPTSKIWTNEHVIRDIAYESTVTYDSTLYYIVAKPISPSPYSVDQSSRE